MRPGSRLSAFLAIVLLVGLPAFAQTTANLSGTVTTDGAPLPGATVTISSPQMQGTRTATTGDSGGYSFAGLPPGDYTVKVELEGMQPTSKSVKIGVGQNGRADVDLKLAAVAEAITVTASAPTVLETPQVSQNVTGELIDELPIARTVLAAALLAPGVNSNTVSAGQLSISGSPGYDNLVMVNGVSITENVRHQSLNLFVEDAIQETTILTGAISAEYGGFTGGVVNSITKSGGNSFTGSLRDSITNPSWQELTPRQAELNTQLVDVTNNSYEGTLGGYILRDRLWFFASGRSEKITEQFFLRTIPGSTFSQEVNRGTDEKRYEVKLTGQITPRHNVVGSYFDLDRKRTNDFFTTTSYDLNQLTNRRDPQTLKSAHYNGVLANNWLLEGRYSAMDWGVGIGSGSKFTDFVRGTIVRNRADGNARYNSATFCGVCDKETRSNDGWSAKTHYFLSNKGYGDHDLVAGVERFAEHRFANNYQSGSNFRLFVNSVQFVNNTIYPTLTPGPGGSATYLVWTPIFALQQNESDLGSDSLFINDRWNLNANWSFSVGMRYDKNNATDGSGNKVSDDSKLTPRLNATYDLKGNGRHRFTASYANYSSRIVDGPGTAGSSGGSPAYIYFAYQGPAINPAGTPVGSLIDTPTALAMVNDWFTHACNAAGQCGTANLSLLRANSSHSVPGYDVRIDSALSSPYVQEFTFGYGAQWLPNLVTRVDVISRDWKDFYGFRVDQTTPQQTDPLGIAHDVAIVENTNDITRKYRGIQFQGTFTPPRFNMGLNYTYSTLKGNDEQESATSGTIGNSPGPIYYAEISNYAQRQPEGYLLQDQRHRARAWVGYDVPLPPVLGHLNASVLQSFDSGTPYSAIGTINMAPYFTKYLPASSRYVAAPGNRQYYFSKRGEFRLDDVSSTNVALNYRFPIMKVELYAVAEMLNVFDRSTVTNVNTTVAASGTSANFAAFDPFTQTPVECPQGTPAATCRANGANWQKGANFGLPASASASTETALGSFQLPRTWRFQVGFRF